MPIFKRIAFPVSILIAVLAMTGAALALDASKLIKPDTKSSTIIELFLGYMKEGKSDDAVDVLKYAADKGDSAAQWKLAKLYETGQEGVQKDPLAAFKMFHKIAQNYTFARPNTASWQFSADALVALGNYYRRGIPNSPIESDPSQAVIMYTTAAMVFRHPDAQFQLGRMQIRNDSVFGQGRLGVRNLTLAHKKGHVGAQALLGYSRFEGVHTRYNPVQGLKMLANALNRANERDREWIRELHDEAFALASPGDRAKAYEQIAAAESKKN